MGDARKSQSAFFLPRTTPVNQAVISQQQKRQRTDTLEVPNITINNERSGSDSMASSSVETIISATEATEYSPITENRIAVRHDRLMDKIDRYNSHNQFIRKCMTGNVIPKSYQVTVEPSIGNHDDEFLKGYYDLCDNFAKQLMTYTADYCAKKTTEFEAQCATSTEELKAMTTTATFTELKKTFEVNRDKRRKALQEIKDKKFIRLKYRSQHQNRNQFPGESSNNNYEQQNVPPRFRQGNISRKNSRTNLGGQGQLSRKNSRSRLVNPRPNHNGNHGNQGDGIDNKIDELARQLNELRQTQQQGHTSSYSGAVKYGGNNTRGNVPNNNTIYRNNNGTVINDKYVPNHGINNNMNTTPPSIQQKNVSPGQPAQMGTMTNNNEQGGSNNNNVEVTEVLDYISTAMQTLGEFEKRFRQRVNTAPTPSATL